jgi:hypothetical protein
MLDLAVSVVAGVPWFGALQVETRGPVTLFLGEGGERNAIRRIRAVAVHKRVGEDELEGLRLCYRVPLLTSEAHLAAMAAELKTNPPIMVGLEPLYLAAAGARGSDLYAMGEHLGAVQAVCEDAGAALVVSTHWNKTGEGNGASRFTGVGPGAWGRVLASAAVEQSRTEDRRSVVSLRWEFTGGEVLESTVRVRRTVWAEDEGLDSPLHYEAEVITEAEGTGYARELSDVKRRILAALEGTTDVAALETAGVQERVANDGKGYPLKTVTIRRHLNELIDQGLVDCADEQCGLAKRWWSK